MKKNLTFTLLMTASLATAAWAGQPMYTGKSAPAPEPEPVYGTGFYVAPQAGINAYQDFGGTRRFSLGGRDVTLEPKEKIGFVGGLKMGYVFGTATVRPAIEADLYYNGVQADLDARVDGKDTDFNAQADLHSGAFIANFLVRFSFQRFQPYIGGGVGGYYAEADDVEVTVNGKDYTSSGGNNSGFAWQLIAGADYYFTEKVSTFLEYKFLNYEDAGINEDRIGQQLVVLGVRWHF
jgi:opacity protein-like surface antigen